MLKRRGVITVIGLILICLLIWFLSDYIAWLENPGNMLLAMAVPVGLVAAWEAFKRVRAAQANNRLAKAVVSQGAEQRPSADVVQLRERFEEAVATLKQQKKKGGLGLYELPWYVIIGAPGSGKTTALKYSGLRFPLEQRSGRGALRGVGGTRNCDWWFTEEAVLLDTAGRYTTQDSDASADSAGWAEFLALLKKYRKRRPLNGVLLTISAQDLMTQGQSGREAHVAAARRRLNELNKELRIQLPVYVLVTKCDLMAGFSEYFDDMSQEDRAQVLGVTFAREITLDGSAAKVFPGEFDAVVQRLNERVFSRLEGERDSRRRAKIFGFPQQLASLREGLAEYVAEIFESTRFDQRVLLRGVYFTSGTQEGTPIDRLLGALSRRFSVAAENVAPGARGKSYFIERLMKQVVLAESGLAGVSRRLELQKAAAQLALYLGMVVAGVILLLLMSNSYQTNAAFLTEFKDHVIDVSQSLPPAGKTVDQARPRLDQLRAVVNTAFAYREDTPWFSRGWGLDRAGRVERATSRMYAQELQQILVGAVRDKLAERLNVLLNEKKHLDVYLTLRAYLMLRETDYFNRDEVRQEAMKAWEAAYPNDAEGARSLDEHFVWLLENAAMQPISVDDDLVRRARESIPPTATTDLILARVIQRYADDHRETEPIFPAGTLRARDGRPLGQGLPLVFTEPGFRQADDLIKNAEKQFREEKWVWDREPPAALDSRNKVWDRYEAQYIDRWRAVVNALGVPSNVSADRLMEIARELTAERVGLKAVLETVDRHTYLLKLPDGKAEPGAMAAVTSWMQRKVEDGRLYLRNRKQSEGALITREFLDIHFLVASSGGKSVIDQVLENVKAVEKGTAAMKDDVGTGPSSSAARSLTDAAAQLEQSAKGLSSVATEIANGLAAAAKGVASSGTTSDLDRRFQEVREGCSVLSDRYPFSREASSEVGLQDFQSLFGPAGAFARFADQALPGYAQREGRRWVAKELEGKRLAIDGILAQVNAAERIREAFFPTGQLGFNFTVRVRELESDKKFELSEGLFKGKPFLYENAGMPPMEGFWPTEGGEIWGRFTTDGKTNSMRGGEGPWSFFQLIKRYGSLVRVDNLTYDVTLKNDQSSVLLRIVTRSENTPLSMMQLGSLATFRCGR